MNLVGPAPGPEERQVVQEKILQFGGLKRFRLRLDAQPWLEVKTHEVLPDSEYLKNYIDEVAQDSSLNHETASSVHHFKIVCDEGEIDIIAETVVISLIDEIPFIAHAGVPEMARAETEGEVESKYLAGKELICSFCGNPQSDFATIIKAATANICGECVEKCRTILTTSNTE